MDIHDDDNYATNNFIMNHPATTQISTLSLHDALPISYLRARLATHADDAEAQFLLGETWFLMTEHKTIAESETRSEEHTSELQSRQYLVCRLLLEKKKIRMSVKDCWRHPLRTRVEALL